MQLYGAAAPKLTLSIAGSWGYELQNVTCGALTSFGWCLGTTTMLSCAVSYVDTFVLMNYRNNAYGCYCRPANPKHPNPKHYQCPADGTPIAGNCTMADANADGMISKAVSAAKAVKASPYKPCRLALGVETSCFPKGDWADKKYQYKLSFCGTSAAYLASQIQLTAQGLGELGLWAGVADEVSPFVVEDFKALMALEKR